MKYTDIIIKEVTTKADLRRFVDYPNVLYKDVKAYIPAIFEDDMDDWDPKKNPAFSYCEARNWLALRDGEVVGRIGAILSHRANETWNTKRMRFTQVDFIDDRKVSAALFAVVEDWARAKGCNQVHGPLGFCDLDREGMLVEGFDERSMCITYYNHPYYNDHLAALGYGKDTDWVENLLTLPDASDENAQKLSKLSERLLQRGKYHKVPLKSKKDITPRLFEQVFELINKAYAPLYGVVKISDNQVSKYAEKFMPVLSPDYLCLVMNEQEELVAFGACIPSLADALKRSNGKLFPTGWFHILRAQKTTDTLDLLLIAVDPQLQGSGLNVVVMDHILQGAQRNGIVFAETGPTLETNDKVQSQWKFFEHRQHKRRRCYIKDLD